MFAQGTAGMLQILAMVNPRFKGAAEGAGHIAAGLQDASDGFSTASDKAAAAGDAFFGLAEEAHNGQLRVDALRAALAKVKDKDVRIRVRTTVTSAFDAVDAAVQAAQDAGATGDTRAPWGAGPALGTAGLAEAHALFTAGLGGHRITSGVRHHNLGSVNSDHARGRAMDVTGPRLGSYALAVRKAGGHAAFHGDGATRHLHVVPVTHHTPTPSMTTGDTLHAEVHFHGAAPSPFNARRIVAGALRDADRDRRERGGR
jgi:hypothetical protein